jgi:type I restriction enzyme, R subunit
MNEAETRAELIDPALRDAGWGVVEASRIRREVIAPGRLEGQGRRAKAEIADYVLFYRNTKLAVIEAKARGKSDTEGLAQAKNYALKLQARFAFSTNGLGIYRVDMETGAEVYLPAWPSPEELWAQAFPTQDAWRDRFAAVPFVEKGEDWALRYYQANAVNKALERVQNGGRRILLTLATGTGKTTIAFQFAWKLFEAKWTLSGEPTRRPRILFLADRNNLADQAYNDFNSFAAFEESGLVRIKPDEIAKRGRVPINGAVFFTIFQTFMSGRDAAGEPAPCFGDYPEDFFDCVIIDECHRGGAKDESAWRAILDYFAPALQLGLTATPKRTINSDTYAYFGEPVYVYSLKQGINDGYLTPFKVKQIATTLDDYVYVGDDEVLEGEVEAGRRYREPDFNRIIEIKAREEYRVRLFMSMIDQRDKTLVFCATQDHALAVRDLINQMKTSRDPHYCARVTANDGEIGDRHLRDFRDNEKTIPTILTTSQKLSTGVDARNVRNIVLMRPIRSMIEFKQIVGRGTRLYEARIISRSMTSCGPTSISTTRNGTASRPSRRPRRRRDRAASRKDRRRPMTTAAAKATSDGKKSGSSSPTARSGSFSRWWRRPSGARTGGRCRRRNSSIACSASCRLSSRTRTSCDASGAARTRARRSCKGSRKKASARSSSMRSRASSTRKRATFSTCWPMSPSRERRRPGRSGRRPAKAG